MALVFFKLNNHSTPAYWSTATNNVSKQDLEVASMLGLMWGIEPFWDAVQ